MLCVLLVWWGSDCGAAVGCCFYVLILFRFTNKKLISLENKPHNEKFKFYVHERKFFKIFEFGVTHTYCGAYLLPQPRFYFSQPLPMPPPHCLCRRGGGCSAISPITGPKFDSMRLMLVDTVCNVYFIFLFPSCKNVGGRGNGPYSNFSNFYIFSLCLAVGLYDTRCSQNQMRQRL